MTIIDSQLDTTASQSDAVVENAITNNYVTVSVSRDVVAGREADYEAWISGITTESSRFGGHLGVNVIRPSLGSRRYTIIYRFDNMDHAKALLTTIDQPCPNLGHLEIGTSEEDPCVELTHWPPTSAWLSEPHRRRGDGR